MLVNSVGDEMILDLLREASEVGRKELFSPFDDPNALSQLTLEVVFAPNKRKKHRKSGWRAQKTEMKKIGPTLSLL
jgi:hypothetical protein